MKFDDLKKSVGAVKRLLNPGLPPNPQPLDLRVAVVDDIEQQVVAVGSGERSLPYERVVVRVLACAERGQVPLERAFADLEARVRKRLGEIQCPVPAGLELQVRVIKRVPAGWVDGQHFRIDYSARSSSPSRQLRLTVLKGVAAKKRYFFPPGTVLIGRMREVEEAKGSVRVNDVAFADSELSVSRAHARITYTEIRKVFQIVDERSRKGTRIVRNGKVTPVPADHRGVVIRAGDEIRVGGARIAVSIE